MKIFAPKKITAANTILPHDEVKLFYDLGGFRVDPEKAKKIIAKAEELLTVEFEVAKASDYRDYFISGSRAKYSTAVGKRREVALYMALAEYIEGHTGRFAEKLMDVVWATMEESTWIHPAHNNLNPNIPEGTCLPPIYENGRLHGVDLHSANIAAMLSIVYLLAKKSLDNITPIICNKIEYMLHERITLPFMQLPFWWTGEAGNRVNNWGPWVVSNVLLVCAVIERDPSVREVVVDRSLLTLDNFLNDYKEDGGCDEGPTYWGAAGASLFDCLEILEELSGGRINVYDEPLIKNMGEYIFKMNINENMFVNFADCGPKLTISSEMLDRFGRKVGSEGLVAFAKKHYQGQMHVNVSHGYRCLCDLTAPAPVKVECDMPTAGWMPNLKVMTLRESGNTAVGTFLAAKGGHNGEMHNHNDVGNFVVYRAGKPVLIDTGVGTYTKQTFSADRYKLWFMQSGYHNLPSFGGVDQRQGADFRSTDEVFDESSRTLSMEISAAYTPDAGLLGYRRTLSLSGGTVTVTDRYKLNEAKECVFHFMSASEPSLVADGKIALAEGMHLYYDTSLKCEIEGFDPVGMNTKAMWDTEVMYRICLSAYGSEGEYVFKISPSDPVAQRVK